MIRNEITTVRMIGEAQGHLWWPTQGLASIPMDTTVARRDGRTLADIVKAELDDRSGDFRDAALLSGDTVIVISRIRWDGFRDYARRRCYRAADLPSLRGLVAPADDHDANGRPLIGPCYLTGCSYASRPGGVTHDGPHSIAIPRSRRCTSRCPAAGYRFCEYERGHPSTCYAVGYRWQRGRGHARPFMIARPT